ncbi:hypothetical protein ACFYNW_34065 [Streptomyces virginiae]|uniref:hypothetical protein n=1 Tax=Streptomyces virginiae TaxID=1961 RepID=UPI0036E5CB87
MPNQLAVTKVLTEDVVGQQKWNARTRRYETIPMPFLKKLRTPWLQFSNGWPKP